MPIVELEHVRKVYDTKVAVNDLCFTIEPGTMFGLLGPNGSGKTSSIRMMIGITVPDSGTVPLFDQPFNRDALKRVGYLPEERGLYKKMKVLDQLIFLGQLHGLDATTASQRAHAWCERLEITEAIPKKTEELSKGMQQKIQFISTLLHEPELIIMDEPFSGLDPVNAVLLRTPSSISASRARPSSSPPTAWTRSRSSATPSPSSIAATSSSPAPCARSSRATRATASSSSSKATTRFLHHPAIEEAKTLPAARRDQAPHLADGTRRRCAAAARRCRQRRRPHHPLRGHGAHARRDLHRKSRQQTGCETPARTDLRTEALAGALAHA